MKKVLLSIFLFCPILSSWGQDVILFKNGSEISVKVMEIRDRTIVYQDYLGSTTNKEVYQADVFSITYENGEKETFKESSNSSQDYSYPKTSKTYHVGELFNSDNVQGIVISTSDGGRHGLILSIDNILAYEGPMLISNHTAWFVFADHGATSEDGVFFGATDKDDGWKNHIRISTVVSNSSLKWSNFEAFNKCRELGEGWYLPAYNEMNQIFNLCEDNSLPKNNKELKRAIKEVNVVLKSLGADKLYYGSYCTSTEADARNVYFWGTLDSGEWEKGIKAGAAILRHVHKF